MVFRDALAASDIKSQVKPALRHRRRQVILVRGEWPPFAGRGKQLLGRRGATALPGALASFFGGLADVERDLIRTRTAEGRSRATARGQHMGRPSA